MWAGEVRASAANARFRFLGLQRGQPTIYERFLANVARAGLHDMVLPIRATATVGLRLLGRLREQRRLTQRPQVIHLICMLITCHVIVCLPRDSSRARHCTQAGHLP